MALVTSSNEKPRILINSGDTGNHGLKVEAVGHKSSRDAVTAKLKVTAPLDAQSLQSRQHQRRIHVFK